MRGLSVGAWVYVTSVVLVAGGVIAASSFGGMRWSALGVLALLFWVCDSIPTRLSVERARVSLSFAAGLASVVILGPVGAGLVGGCAVVTGQLVFAPVKRVFNGAQFALSGYAAGIVFTGLGGTPYKPGEGGLIEHLVGPFLGALLTFGTANLLLTGGILLLSRSASVHELLRESRELAAAILGYGMLGLLIAGLYPAVGAVAAVLGLFPLLVARWAFDQARAQQRAHAAAMSALCRAVETKDSYTRGHSERVSRGSVMIGTEIGMHTDRLQAIRYAGMLHDVGKVGVPTKVLQKPGKFTDEEHAAMQLHPMLGREIVRELGFLDEALSGIMHHHEKMNGRGYPMGLAGDEIPEFARVIGVADAFDAMTTARSYKSARSIEEAVAELRLSAGEQFDPVIVDAFLRALRRDGWELPAQSAPAPENTVQ